MRFIDVAGLVVAVPTGWEARGTAGARAATSSDGVTYPCVHVASFPLPPTRAAYGGGAVERMASGDCFVAIIEFAPTSAHTPLFAAQGVPRRLRAAQFSPAALQRTIPPHLGLQRFFTEAGRALCVYVVMGGLAALSGRLDELNRALDATLVRARVAS